MMKTLKGKVISGRGRACSVIEENSKELKDITSQKIYPGSLNVVLNKPVQLNNTRALRFDRDKRLLWPATVDNKPVWLYRWSRTPLHLVEIISRERLRDTLNLQDNTSLSISIDEQDIARVSWIGAFIFYAVWLGRKNWAYTNDQYYHKTKDLCMLLGATQRGFRMKYIKRYIKRKVRKNNKSNKNKYYFSRINTDDILDINKKEIASINNILNYTKTSGSAYSARIHPAGYHTLNILGEKIQGQRNPSLRLQDVPFVFEGKTVLDIGTNQGGMLFALADQLKWGVGIDYDPYMINAANKIRNVHEFHHLEFYVLNVDKDPLDLVKDFCPQGKPDIIFLLSVCMWLDNWKELIQHCAAISDNMLFESNGKPQQQNEQEEEIRKNYNNVTLVSTESKDDQRQKNRKLYLCRR